ncbi:uroporphyrinogen decarboxylase family protein [Mahella australiensis]|uniref:Uroporphyrinogen decarboxylase (URO-D) domain-containing protein n=1 Tax=Mahella australiensis (strain DSM 15567 / CIP 107919 / 50-1 BON) TaxID=697281 RepID=F4A0C2_MAHA5|nr:uroporphyrinogen decarboxylase family protein [Mahella australiensis]AEE97983.1 hypothetical protein Mahau_2859 [Mahella australiensis 50-1 BON]
MTPKQRMVTAFKNQQPDMIPVAPDMSNMIPCRLTGKPFWDIYLYNNPPLSDAYIDAVKYFGFDGWSDKGGLGPSPASQCTYEHEILQKTDERIVRKTICRTPEGDLESTTVYYVADPPTVVEKYIKDIKKDLPKAKYLFPDPSQCSLEPLRLHMERMGDMGAVGGAVGIPGFQGWVDLIHGGVEAMTYMYYDYHDEIMELADIHHQYAVAYAKRLIEAGPDFILIGASGLLTLQSPSIFRELSLPSIKEITHMARQAGIPSHLHSCGKERWLVEVLSEETELDSIEPLEQPPMGDCDLAEIKQKFGRRIALKGNLHTTKTMLYGTPKDVKRECLKTILAAGEGGGFVLSTGDQCGRDTPDENIFTMVETAREFGRYPLDYDRISRELERLE